MYFTRDGLEQATRPEVAAHHASRFAAAGARRLVDLGCGIGSDALAALRTGLAVVCVEVDPATAEVARLNLAAEAIQSGLAAEVITGDAESLAAGLVEPEDGVFCDPARRTSAGRLWRVEDFTPPWEFVLGLLGSGPPAGIKLGPALPHALIPDHVEAEWVSHRGDTLEVGLWSAPVGEPGARAAMVLPTGSLRGARLVVPPKQPVLDVRAPGRYLYEPDGAVIRAGGVTTVGELVGGALLDNKIAYLTSDASVDTPLAARFEVLEVLPYKEKTIKGWLREHRVGSLEIKKRGVDLDPAQLRRRLSLSGPESATLILSRTPRGGVGILAQRVAPSA